MADLFVSMTELGATLRKARAKKGWALAELAEESGLSTSFLSLVENGKSDISLGRLARLMETLEVSLTDLAESSYSDDDGHETYRTKRRTDELRIESATDMAMSVLLASKKHRVERSIMTFRPGAWVDYLDFGDHRADESFFLMLKGALVFSLTNGDEVRLAHGDCVRMPANLWTRIENKSRYGAEVYLDSIGNWVPGKRTPKTKPRGKQRRS